MNRRTPDDLPRSARDVVALAGPSGLLCRAVVSFADATGIWTYPMRCRGDFPEMGFFDKAYWIYKAGRPTTRARRGSGLEAYFAQRAAERAALPAGFRADASITVSASGDLMTHRYLERSRDTLYASVADLVFGVDLSMANLECVVCPPDARELVIRMAQPGSLDYDAASFAAATTCEGARFDLLSAASNHTLDHGAAGVDGTLRALEDAGIACAGVTPLGGDPDGVTVLERRGIRVGIIAYTFGLNGARPPSDRPHIVHRMRLNDGVAAADLTALERHIERCRSERVDFVVAQLHWGLEHELYPVPEQVELAHHLAELGADAILGHHPHVVQPMELHRTRRDPDRVVPIYYSLGNLVNPFSAALSCVSGVARLVLSKGRCEDGSTRVYVRSAELARVRQVVDHDAERIRIVRAA